MVFIAVGTQKQQFNRIFKIVENSNILKDEQVIAQSGFTKYNSNKVKMLGFISQDELNEYIKTSDLVICHGGVGTIFTALRYKKKVLVIPRLKKYKEHKNDHQVEICEELQKNGYILYLKDGEDLDEKLEKLKDFKFKEYLPDNRYIKILTEVI